MPYLKFKQWFSGNQAEGAINAGEVRNFSPQRAQKILQTGKAVISDADGNEQQPPHESAPETVKDETVETDETTATEETETDKKKDKRGRKTKEEKTTKRDK